MTYKIEITIRGSATKHAAKEVGDKIKLFVGEIVAHRAVESFEFENAKLQSKTPKEKEES